MSKEALIALPPVSNSGRSAALIECRPADNVMGLQVRYQGI